MIQEKKEEKDVSLKRLQTGVDKIDEASGGNGFRFLGQRYRCRHRTLVLSKLHVGMFCKECPKALLAR